MTWDPRKMTYGEMDRARQGADLCRTCRHREVCSVPVELERREGWHLSVATCAHYEADVMEIRQEFTEGFDPDRVAQSFIENFSPDLPPLAARWRLAWAEVAGAYARDLLRQAEEARRPDTAEIRLAERFADRELQAARREYQQALDNG